MKALMTWTLAVCVALTLAGDQARACVEVATTISVPGMDCGGCAKKLSTALSKVAGVAKVEADIEAKTLKVTPKAQTTVSPKALWEALEKAGKAPNKLEGPGGTFTSKPAN